MTEPRTPGYHFSLLQLLVAITLVGLFCAVARMEDFSAWLALFAIQAAIGIVLSAPIVYFSRRRVAWRWWESLALVLPYLVWWSFAITTDGRGKSLSNLVEPLYSALAIPLAALARVTIGRRGPEVYVATVLLAALCAVAAAVYVFTPALPE